MNNLNINLLSPDKLHEALVAVTGLLAALHQEAVGASDGKAGYLSVDQSETSIQVLTNQRPVLPGAVHLAETRR